MRNWLSRYFEEKRRKRQLRKYTEQCLKHLQDIEVKTSQLRTSLLQITGQRYLVTDSQINALCAQINSEYVFLNASNPLETNDVSREFFETENHWVKQTREFQLVTKRFQTIKTDFMDVINRLDSLKEEVNHSIEKNGFAAEAFLREIESAQENYIANSLILELKDRYQETFDFFRDGHSVKKPEWIRFLDVYQNFELNVVQWNQAYINDGLHKWKSLFDDIDGKSLDNQQRVAVLTDEDNNLVLAGAGSGKTLTISGKVKFLGDKKSIKPEEILLISFTNKASEEMKARITGRLNVPVDVFTFHKLGLRILSEVHKRKPDIFDGISDVLQSYMKTVVYNDRAQIQRLIEFFGFYINIPKDLGEFDSLGEYHEHVRHVDFETLRGKVSKTQYLTAQTRDLQGQLKTLGGETVKSLEETLIANFLFLNGVEYEYEHPYEHPTGDERRRQYKPDFYLPEYGIYIEHFGVNEHMKTPWLSEIEEAKYIEDMKWKRELHREHGTTLIESFSFYNREGILFEKLRENLLAHQVKFREVDFREIFEAIYDHTKGNYFKEFLKLIETFIGLFKSNGFSVNTFEEFKQINRESEPNAFLRARTEVFFDLVKPIFTYYEDYLKAQRAIDFNDMINEATVLIRAGEGELKYKYIIIDEYQDISRSRFNLVKAIKDRTGAKVMCVGDDWQSIYRFAGADIELFTRFGDFFGKHELLKIEKTYRNAQELIDIAGKFVMQNPHQYRKDLRSDKHHERPIEVIGFQHDVGEALTRAVDAIVSIHGSNIGIMLLGRNKFDIEALDKSEQFHRKYNAKTNQDEVTYKRYPNLRMYFLTTHRSKGLEADNVILINTSNGLLGFPNRISDDPILSWVLTDYDDFNFAEERRLLYVALTRTRNQTFILTPDKRMSPFVKELVEKQHVPYTPPVNGSSQHSQPRCPKCKTGVLVERDGTYGSFVACSNYPTCDTKFNQASVLTNPIRCNKCKGYMVKRKSQYGWFYGCTNFPHCNNTMRITEASSLKKEALP